MPKAESAVYAYRSNFGILPNYQCSLDTKCIVSPNVVPICMHCYFYALNAYPGNGTQKTLRTRIRPVGVGAIIQQVLGSRET